MSNYHIKEENKLKALERLRQELARFSAPELAWDFHCNLSLEIKSLIEAEAHKRRINLCRVAQSCRDAYARREPCGLDHMREPNKIETTA